MFLLDSLLIGGIRFVLDKVAAAAEQEMNDETALREQLLNAQMQVELGEMTETQFAGLETSILARLREIRDRREGGSAEAGDLRITGVEATFGGDDR